jgi:hypothetical protein
MTSPSTSNWNLFFSCASGAQWALPPFAIDVLITLP